MSPEMGKPTAELLNCGTAELLELLELFTTVLREWLLPFMLH